MPARTFMPLAMYHDCVAAESWSRNAMNPTGNSGSQMPAPVHGCSESRHAAGRAVVEVNKLRKSFRSGTSELVVLDQLSLRVLEGEIVAIVGPSGAGKSTLLHVLAALDTPTSGTVYCAGRDLGALADAELAEFRNRQVGFVWQRHHLLADFSAEENVAMPLLLRGISRAEAFGTARDWLNEVGLGARLHHRAGELSGGEQQRVAIARALAGRPSLLLADEPTGDLDAQNAEAIVSLLERLHHAHRLTTVLATHNPHLARRSHRVLKLDRGVLVPSAVAEGELG